MLTRRVVVCLDVSEGRVVKGTRFVELRDVGDPVELATRYEREGADEIVFLDISASAEGRTTLLDVARRTAEELFIPLTIGGGIRSANDMGHALRAGADKVSINSAAVARPAVLSESADRFGSQCVVASIDAKWDAGWSAWRVYIKGGREPTSLDAVQWAQACVSHGAGEILLTSIDRDGARTGYDVELTEAVSAAVNVPVIASGGAGSAEHVCDVLQHGADAALLAGILHDRETTVADVKRVMRAAGLEVRS
ncbi:MAG TPA: imidazole glycerol phosphate synthase subunit HisF [Gemmatimonadaceae bacterium]